MENRQTSNGGYDGGENRSDNDDSDDHDDDDKYECDDDNDGYSGGENGSDNEDSDDRHGDYDDISINIHQNPTQTFHRGQFIKCSYKLSLRYIVTISLLVVY